MKENYCLQAALVCLGMLCHSQAFATERRSHLRPSFHGHHEKGKEGQVLQRSKRGWVWNQFFVIEEYTGPDPVLVGRVRLLSLHTRFLRSTIPVVGYGQNRNLGRKIVMGWPFGKSHKIIIYTSFQPFFFF